MSLIIRTILTATSLLFALTAGADQAIAQANGCIACHQVEVKLVGPSYKDVAAKYQGEESAAELLRTRVRSGGVGNWGQIPMPPNTTISDADLAAVIDWILAAHE